MVPSWPLMCFSILIFNMSNTMCVTKRARTAYACERSEYTLVFISGVRVGKPFFVLSSFFCHCIVCASIYIRLKMKPNSVRIRFVCCQIFVLPSTGFELTPLIHCSTNHLALCSAPYIYIFQFSLFKHCNSVT